MRTAPSIWPSSSSRRVRLEDVEKIDVRMCELSIRQASAQGAPNLNAAMGSTEFGVALALAGGRNGLREYWDGFNDQRVRRYHSTIGAMAGTR